MSFAMSVLKPHRRAPWQSLVAMGLSGILIDESQGGAGLGMLDAMVVSEALGYAACPGPFLSSSIMAAHYLSCCR